MATLPKTVSYEEWLGMPVGQEGREEVVNGEIRIMPPNKSPHPKVMRALQLIFAQQLDLAMTEFFAEGALKPRHFPNVQIDIARIWPD